MESRLIKEVSLAGPSNLISSGLSLCVSPSCLLSLTLLLKPWEPGGCDWRSDSGQRSRRGSLCLASPSAWGITGL